MKRETMINAALLLAMIAVPLWAYYAGKPFTITLATKVAILALAGVGLNIALGIGGLVSFGHAAFFGLGGYTMGILASHAQSYSPLFNWPFLFEGSQNMLVIWGITVLVSALAGLIIGLLALRTSGVYFIMLSLAFGQMLYYFAISWPAYGGEDGLSIYVRNGFPGLNTLDPIQFFAICFALLLLALFFTHRLMNSPFGLALNAARQSPLRAATVGVGVFRLRLVALIISAIFTGLAGALYADLNRFISPTMLSWQTSGEIMVFVILGGVGRLMGPLAGAALFIILEQVLGPISEYWHIYLGAMLLLVVLFARGGIIGSLAKRDAAHE